MKEDGFHVRHVAALARNASMSTSYKPALLKALVRIARESPTESIDLLTIGEHFVRLYWVQTVVFRLRQAATLVKEPEVVRAVRRAAEEHRVRRLADLPGAVREQLAREMARILRINVLNAFHRSKPADMPELFAWDGSDAVALGSGAALFLRRDGGVLESLANLWWARWLEKVNVLAPHIIEKVERDGASRSSLQRYLRLLRELDDLECFYCGTGLSESPAVHVDHVIPWSFLLADPPWDLVLACSACNLAKSDKLPRRDFLDQLAVVHARRAGRAFPRKFASPFLPPDELYRYYDAALSVEWPSGWTPDAP